MKSVIIFLVGILVGGAIVFVSRSSNRTPVTSDASTANVVSNDQATAVRKQLEVTEGKLSVLQSRFDSISEQNATLVSNNLELAVSLDEAKARLKTLETNDTEQAEADASWDGLRYKIETDLKQVQTRLSLTDAQRREATALIERLLSRPDRREKLSRNGYFERQKAWKTGFQKLLTAGQREDYAAYKEEEAQSMAQIMGNLWLMDYQRAMRFPDEQRIRITQVCTEACYQWLKENENVPDTESSGQRFQQLQDDALKEVLSPEQFEQYKAIEKRRTEDRATDVDR